MTATAKAAAISKSHTPTRCDFNSLGQRLPDTCGGIIARVMINKLNRSRRSMWALFQATAQTLPSNCRKSRNCCRTRRGPHEPQAADLKAVDYGYDASDAILLERNDDMRRRGLASPDDGDALALTFACPVAKRDWVQERRFDEGLQKLKRWVV